MPDSIGRRIVRQAPLVRDDGTVAEALETLVGSGFVALPVVDSRGAFRGIFGEREFITALFPGYVGELPTAAFVTQEMDEHLERRAECLAEPVSGYMTAEHVAVGLDASDMQLAETFQHHRVSTIPIVDAGAVVGVVTRADFVRALAGRFRGEG